MTEPDMPPAVARRPRDARGYPVLFTSHIHPDGTPDFRVSDFAKVYLCAKRRLCGVCGERLGYWMIFIGGPVSEVSRAFADPPMHRECAEYSARICPYLSTRADRSKALQAEHGAEIRANDPSLILEKSDRMGFFLTRGYRVLPHGRAFLFIADPPKEIVWKDLPKR